MQLDAYYSDLMNSVQTNADLDRDYLANAFMAEVGRRLAEAEEVDQLEVVSFDGLGARGKRLAVNGYDLNDSDGSVALTVLDFVSSQQVRTVSTGDARRHLGALQAFLEDSVEGDFLRDREESTQEFQLAKELKARGGGVTRYRLYLITNGVLGDRVKALPSAMVNGVRVDFHIWDLQRLKQVTESVEGREALDIDLTEWAPDGLPVLEVADHDTDFTTFLAAVPATVVAELYGRYGSRLLESNVRSYLSNRGKVNKGIRTTVLKDPAHFLAYNNGITATATAVRRGPNDAVVGLTDLQIVNGGQTTASLFYVSRDERPRPDLSKVFVQMKLVVVEPSVAAEMVPQISRFANSQNRVSEADFFSNSPFHVRLEDLSRRILVPAREGQNFQTKWFYERTRGQYQNEKNKLGAAAQKKFEAQYPRGQMLTKTDAAKFEVTWLMQPHQVSAGAQKNFIAFADAVAKRWALADDQFNELYFRHLVAKGILYNRVRKAISHAPWYESGYLANIVTYTIAKIAHEIDKQGDGRTFDFDRVWTNQDLTPVTIKECVSLGDVVLDALVDPTRPVTNVTEWAKRAQCWEQIKRIPFPLSLAFIDELEDSSRQVEKRRTARANQRIDNGIQDQARAMEITREQWAELRRFALENRLASPADLSLVEIMLGPRVTVPTEKQSARLHALVKKAENSGLLW